MTTLPAYGNTSRHATRNPSSHIPPTRGARDAVVPVSEGTWDAATALTQAALNEELTDALFRVYAVIVATFGTARFTTPQAAKLIGCSIKGSGSFLGRLVSAGLLTSRRVEVGENEHGRPIRTRLYRVVGA